MGWKRNPWVHLYQWIRYLDQEGYSEEKILQTFGKNQATRAVDFDDPRDVAFCTTLVRDALGLLPPGEIDKYIEPSSVTGFTAVKIADEGYLYVAHTPHGEDDFLFLVNLDVFPDAKSQDDVDKMLLSRHQEVCDLLLRKYHTQHPYGMNGTDKVASARIFKREL
ncbi:UNVERIFIED_ORG: hypothetical protein J2Y93_001963 [Pantoea agglomerans]|mgnify:FL=1|nr:MAG TPA_asm: hypothetical protein [Bacteriophage sp.]